MKIILENTAYFGFKRNDAETVDAILQAEQIFFTFDQHFDRISGLVCTIFTS